MNTNSFTMADSMLVVLEGNENKDESYMTPTQANSNQSHLTGTLQNPAEREAWFDNYSTENSKSSEPQRFIFLSEIYNDVEEVELHDELMFEGIEKL